MASPSALHSTAEGHCLLVWTNLMLDLVFWPVVYASTARSGPSHAAGCADGQVVIWDIETRGVAQRCAPHRCAMQTNKLFSFAWSLLICTSTAADHASVLQHAGHFSRLVKGWVHASVRITRQMRLPLGPAAKRTGIIA